MIGSFNGSADFYAGGSRPRSGKRRTPCSFSFMFANSGRRNLDFSAIPLPRFCEIMPILSWCESKMSQNGLVYADTLDTNGATMSFHQAVAACLAKYGTFSGRALRSEFWWFYLFAVLAGLAASVADAVVFGADLGEGGIISGITNIALVVPWLAVSARRLHDTGRSGWWFLIAFTIIGIIFLIVWWAREGDANENQYGHLATNIKRSPEMNGRQDNCETSASRWKRVLVITAGIVACFCLVVAYSLKKQQHETDIREAWNSLTIRIGWELMHQSVPCDKDRCSSTHNRSPLRSELYWMSTAQQADWLKREPFEQWRLLVLLEKQRRHERRRAAAAELELRKRLQDRVAYCLENPNECRHM